MRKLYFLLIALFTGIVTYSQSTANYAFSTGTTASLGLDMGGNPLDMSSGTTSLLTPATYHDDVASAITNLGFTYYFMGVPYNQFTANSNGQIRLGATAISGTAQAVAANAPIIAALSGDNAVRATGSLLYKVFGSAPNRILVVEWSDVRVPFSSAVETGTYSKFQTRLYESTGIIEYVYGRMFNMDATTAASRSVFFSSSNIAGTVGVVTTITTTPTYSSTATTATTSSFTANSDMANLNSTTEGSRRFFLFTPPQAAVADPISLTFTAVTASGMTVNWVDNSSNETNFNVFRSIDGINYTLVSTITSTSGGTTGTAYSYVAANLNGGTTYFWRVVANSEGVASAPLSGSQITNACSVSGTKTIPGDYASITAAAADLNANGVTGSVILELQASYTGAGEIYPIVLGFVPCVSSSNTVTIRPAAGATALLITSAATSTISINSGNYWIIDGRPGGTGTVKDLAISNTATTGNAIQLINDATNNTVRYCQIAGVTTSGTNGVVLFSTSTGTAGNSNNTFDNCDIKDGATTPTNGIYSLGSATAVNANNTISNSNIFNFFSNTTTVGNGILVSTNNTDWTITNNHLYQTAARTFTAAGGFIGISISTTTGNNFTVNNNYIGGSAPSAGGSAWSQTGAVAHTFIGIRFSVGTTTASNAQGNTIQNISISSSTTSTINSGISAVTGSINVGNTTANTIGSQAVAGSIAYVNSGTSTAPNFTGILAGTGTPGVINISNNTIGGISTSTSSTGAIITRGISIQGSGTGSSYTVSGNTIGSTTTANSINNATNAATNGIHSSSSNTLTTIISNNTIANLNASGTSTGNQLVGITTTSGNNTVAGNTVRNLSSTSTSASTGSTSSVVGISQTSTTAGHTISRNTIHSLSNAAASAAVFMIGIHYTGATTGTNVIERNLVYGLSLTSISATATTIGVNIAGGASRYQNNMIRLGLDAAGAAITNGIVIVGIDKATTSSNLIYHNSVYIGGSGVTTTANSLAFRKSSTGTDEVRNNIFVNQRSNAAGAGKHFAIGLNNITTLTLSNNLYHGTGTGFLLGYVGAPGATDYATYDPAWQAASGDANSLFADPLFVSATGVTPNLHLLTSTPAEGSGILIAAVTDDFDGETRASLTPTDIGADAGAFAPIGLDVGITGLVSPGPSAGGCYTATETVTVTLRNFSGATIDFSVNNATVTVTATGGYSSMVTLTSGTLASGASMNVTLPATINLTTSGTYTFNANAVVTGDINTANDAMAPVNRVSLTLNGNYNVGAGQSGSGGFNTLTDAVAAYNSTGCITGAVTFTLTDATYPSETFPITINANVAANSTNTLTIRPAVGMATIVSGTSGTTPLALIRLNGADYITIDGLNTGGSSLTLENTSTSAGSGVLWLSSNGAGAGATNNTIRNTNIKAGVSQNAATTVTYGIVMAGSAFATTVASITAGDDNDNNSFQGNTFTKVRYALFSRGGSSTNLNTGTVISGNTFGPTAFGTEAIGKSGVLLREEDGVLVTNNIFQFIGGEFANTSGGTDKAAIAFGTDVAWSSTSAPTSVLVKNAVITRNQIHDIVDERTFTAAGIIISTADGANPTNNLVANNTIANIKANGTVGDQSVGIALSAAHTDRIVFNSISLTGDVDPDAGATVPVVSANGINVSTTAVVNPLIVNNIVFMDLTSSSAPTLKNAAINIPSAYTWGTGSSNYNDFAINAGNAQSNIGSVGSTAGTFYATLAAWQTATSQDANSISVQPVFTSAINLHLTSGSNAGIDNLGTAITGVTVDIDNQTRSVTTPDMGADEFSNSGGLPAQLLTFSGQRVGNANKLKWIIAQEFDVQDYEIERSENGRTWSKAGSVGSLGNTSAQRTYGFTDNNIGGVKQYYRLRQVDRNGSYKLSNIVVITGIKATMLTLSGLFPNPAITKVNMLVDVPAKDNVTISVIDVAGRVVMAQKGSVEAGSNTLQLNVTGLSQGSYLVKITSESSNETAISKFIKE